MSRDVEARHQLGGHGQGEAKTKAVSLYERRDQQGIQPASFSNAPVSMLLMRLSSACWTGRC